MNENDALKRELLAEIETLMRYDEGDKTTIEPSLLEYLDTEALRQIVQNLRKRRERIIEEERNWLAQFRREE